MNKKYVWAVLGIVILIAIIFLIPQNKPTATAPVENNTVANYEGWKSYSNTYGFSFLYPSDWNFNNYESENLESAVPNENATQFNVSTLASSVIFQIDELNAEEQNLSQESFLNLHIKTPSSVTQILLGGENVLKVNFSRGSVQTKYSDELLENRDLFFIKRSTYALYIKTYGDQQKINQILNSISFQNQIVDLKTYTYYGEKFEFKYPESITVRLVPPIATDPEYKPLQILNFEQDNYFPYALYFGPTNATPTKKLTDPQSVPWLSVEKGVTAVNDVNWGFVHETTIPQEGRGTYGETLNLYTSRGDSTYIFQCRNCFENGIGDKNVFDQIISTFKFTK